MNVGLRGRLGLREPPARGSGRVGPLGSDRERSPEGGPGSSPGTECSGSCPRPHAHAHARERAPSQLVWAHPPRTPRPWRRWPARCILGQPGAPRPAAAAENRLGGGRAVTPLGSASHRFLSSTGRVLGVGEMPFFEETDSIFYREQAVFLFLYRFSDVIFTFAPIPFAGLGREQHRSGHPSGRARPGHAHAARGEARGQGREAGRLDLGLAPTGIRWALPWAEAPGTPGRTQRGFPWRPQRGGVGLSCPGPGRGELPGAGAAVPVAGGGTVPAGGPAAGGVPAEREGSSPCRVVLESLLRREMKTHHVTGCGGLAPTEGRGVPGNGAGRWRAEHRPVQAAPSCRGLWLR